MSVSEEEENILIIEKLLAWKKHPDPDVVRWWQPPNGDGMFISLLHKEFPTFTDWASAGLIMDALVNRGVDIVCRYNPERDAWECSAENPEIDVDDGLEQGDKSGPLAIRAAALDYIRSTEMRGCNQLDKATQGER